MCDSLESRAQPHVLLLATQPWPTGARLGLALHGVGFGVSIWSPSGHPLLKTDAADRHYPYGAVGQDSLETAIVAANPDLIVPCDDPATSRLQRLADALSSTRACTASSGLSNDRWDLQQT